MKTLIVILPDFITEEQIYEMLRDVIGSNIPEGVRLSDAERRIPAIVIDNNHFDSVEEAVRELRSKRGKQIKTSKFMRACEAVFNLLSVDYPADINEVGFRSGFYKYVINGTIEKPVLEVIAFGPTSSEDATYIKVKKCEKLIEYAKIALSMIA